MSEQKKKSKYTVVGEVRKGKDDKFYLKATSDITLKKGESLSLRKPDEKYDVFVKLGKMEEDEAEERKAKIPSYIKYEAVHVEKA